jgi:uncharacterized glyoxalase superfamily protein PhnB
MRRCRRASHVVSDDMSRLVRSLDRSARIANDLESAARRIVNWGMRTLTFADPGGHTWEIAQELPSVLGSS